MISSLATTPDGHQVASDLRPDRNRAHGYDKRPFDGVPSLRSLGCLGKTWSSPEVRQLAKGCCADRRKAPNEVRRSLPGASARQETSQRKKSDRPTRWVDVRDLDVEGKGWTDTKSFLRSPIPRRPRVVRPPVWGLSRQSAGFLARFTSDATTIQARWTVTSSALGKPHMPATGVSGLDLYVKADDGRWALAQCGPAWKRTRPTPQPWQGGCSKAAVTSSCIYRSTTESLRSSSAFPRGGLSRSRPRGRKGVGSRSSSTGPQSRKGAKGWAPGWFTQ